MSYFGYPLVSWDKALSKIWHYIYILFSCIIKLGYGGKTTASLGEKLQRLCQANIFADSVLLNVFYSKIFTDLRFSVGLMPSVMHPARPRL